MADDTKMVTPAQAEIPGTTEHNAQQGGTISTVSDPQTRPQELHGAKAYQSLTGNVPTLTTYTNLTTPKVSVKG